MKWKSSSLVHKRKLGRNVVPGDVVYWTADRLWLVISTEFHSEHGWTSVRILCRDQLDSWAFGFDEGVNVL